MRDQPLFLAETISQLPEFESEMEVILKEVFRTTPLCVDKKGSHRGVLLQNDKWSLLIMESEASTQLYMEPLKKKPFAYADIENNVIYSNKVMSVVNKAHLEAKKQELIASGLSARVTQLILSGTSRDDAFSISPSMYELQQVFELIPMPESLRRHIAAQGGPDQLWVSVPKDEGWNVQKNGYHVKEVFKAGLKNGFDEKNKLESNDLDNHAWIEQGCLCLSSQNFYFVVQPVWSDLRKASSPMSVEGIDACEDWNMYVALRENASFKKAASIKTLLSQIKASQKGQPGPNFLEHGIVEVRKGEVVRQDPAALGLFKGDLYYTLGVLEEGGWWTPHASPTGRTLTVEEHVVQSVTEYPTLYLGCSYDQSKWRVLDRVFNVIGRGDGGPWNQKVEGDLPLFESIESWFGDTPVYLEQKFGRSRVVFEESLGVQEIEKSADALFVPYPNFSQKYSPVWSEEYEKMNDNWKQAALEFYQHVQEFFKDDSKNKFYHGAFTKNLVGPVPQNIDHDPMHPLYTKPSHLYNKAKGLLADVKLRLQKLSLEKIEQDYEIPFFGSPANDTDVADFLERRWFKEKARIMKFLEETIEKIQKDLHPQTKASQSRIQKI